MIGCLNTNGHDCGKSDLDTVSFVPLDVLEDAEIRRQVGHEAPIYDYLNDNELFDEVDIDIDETFWSSLLLGADYDWDDEPEETPAEWVARRYGDVIELNEKFGYAPTSNVVPFSPSFVGRSRTNVRPQHWSDRRTWREDNPNYDKLRGKAHAK